MPDDTRLRSPALDRDPILEWPQKPSSKSELEELRAKVNLLEYGGITADKLGGGTISTQSIELAQNASLYSGTSAADGFILDKNGLRFYDGGVNTIDLRADGGTATFSGNITASTITGTNLTGATITGGIIRTAASGERIELSNGFYDEIHFYTGEAAETAPGRMLVSNDIARLSTFIIAPATATGDTAVVYVATGRTTQSATVALQVQTSGGTNKGNLFLDSHDGLTLGGLPYLTAFVTNDVSLQVNAGYFDIFRPAATNNLQIRMEGPAGGQCAIGVDGPGTGNRMNVQNFAGTTPLPISASAFTVVSKTEGKKDIKDRKVPVLAKVKKLRPVEYVRPGEKVEGRKAKPGGKDKPGIGTAPDQKHVGFLVEEMMTHFPEAVVKDGKGDPHSIDLMAVVAILTQAIQELAS